MCMFSSVYIGTTVSFFNSAERHILQFLNLVTVISKLARTYITAICMPMKGLVLM
jgi:hypothetical protein